MGRNNEKGQAQIVTAVLLTGIIITLVAVAYIWGVPMIEKQKGNVKTERMESFMKDLNEKIQDIAKHGGTENVKVNLVGRLSLVDNGWNDLVRLEFETRQNLYAEMKNKVLVGENNETSLPMGSPPGVLQVTSEKINDKYRIRFELFFRELLGQTNSYKVDLISSGRSQVGDLGNQGRETTIIISSAGSEEKPGQGEGGKDLQLNKVKVGLR